MKDPIRQPVCAPDGLAKLRRVIAVALAGDAILRLSLGHGFHDFFVLIVLAVLYAKTASLSVWGDKD